MFFGLVIGICKKWVRMNGYQTLINDTLRRAVEGEALITEVRHVLQQELAAYKVR